MHSWRILILPYIEGSHLYAKYNFDEPWNGPNNRKLAQEMPHLFAFPDRNRDPGNTTTNYLAVVGPETVWPGETTVSINDIKDGPGQSILLVENEGAGIHWMEPRDLLFSDLKFQVNVPGGLNTMFHALGVAMVDTSNRSFTQDISAENLRAYFIINGQEVISLSQ